MSKNSYSESFSSKAGFGRNGPKLCRQTASTEVSGQTKEGKKMRKKRFKRLTPSEFFMLKKERKERDLDAYFNKRNGGAIAERAAAAEKEWRRKLNLDANLHRTPRRSAGTR
jgi:hypothetical protein